MNRLDTLLPPVAASSPQDQTALRGDVDRFSASIESSSATGAASLASFAPMNYESGYAYPLLVWLHGPNQSEDDLPEVMSHVSTRNYVAVAPRGPGAAAHPWSPRHAGAADAEDLVFEAIDAADQRFNIHGDRVFLAGVGCGGSAALRLALAYPDRFAGAASFDGPVPAGGAPLRNLKAVRGLPVFLATASDSRRYPEARVCGDLRLLYSAGCTMSIRHEPGDGDLTTGMLAELDRWMMAIVCGDRVSAG